MNYDIVEALSQIAREKGVELKVLVERLESSLLSAAKRRHGLNSQITVNFDEEAGSIEMVITKIVVSHVTDPGAEMTVRQAKAYNPDASVGDEIVIPLDIAEFGRNAIQAAKQVLIQGVREAERERVYSDFADKVGDIVRGVVQQVDRGTIILKLDTAEAVIPAREVLHRDRFRQREMVRALVIDVDKEAKGPQIILSRASSEFLTKLFAVEVPEIADRIVELKAVAREAGHRSKIAVSSNDDRVDAVGACVGIKGTRVQSIVKELGGERIDIVPWSADPVVFVSRSLAPARVLEAHADPETRTVTVIVPDDQLSLAIGKQGQNARLAAKLSGWKIELHSDTEYAARHAVEQADVSMEELEGVTEAVAAALLAEGVETAKDIERKGVEILSAMEGVGPEEAERLFAAAAAALTVAREDAAREAIAAQQAEADPFAELMGDDPEADEADEADEDTEDGEEAPEDAGDDEVEAAQETSDDGSGHEEKTSDAVPAADEPDSATEEDAPAAAADDGSEDDDASAGDEPAEAAPVAADAAETEADSDDEPRTGSAAE